MLVDTSATSNAAEMNLRPKLGRRCYAANVAFGLAEHGGLDNERPKPPGCAWNLPEGKRLDFLIRDGKRPAALNVGSSHMRTFELPRRNGGVVPFHIVRIGLRGSPGRLGGSHEQTGEFGKRIKATEWQEVGLTCLASPLNERPLSTPAHSTAAMPLPAKLSSIIHLLSSTTQQFLLSADNNTELGN